MKTNGSMIGEKLDVTQSGGFSGKFDVFDHYTYKVVDNWPYRRTVTTTQSTTTLNETTNNTCTVTVTATGFPSGTTLYYTLHEVSGYIENPDFSGDAPTTSGSFTVTGTTASSTGTFDIVVQADGTVEGAESFQFKIRRDSTSGTVMATGDTITISDTSTSTTALSSSWYISAFGATIGALKAYCLRSDGSVVYSGTTAEIYSRSAGGAANADWIQSFPSSRDLPYGTYRLAWFYNSGASFTGDIALDTIVIQGTTYNFDSVTGWEQSGTGSGSSFTTGKLETAFGDKQALGNAVNGRWGRRSGSTSSSNTGPTGAQSSTHYVYAETSGSGSGFSNQNFWLFSPTFSITT